MIDIGDRRRDSPSLLGRFASRFGRHRVDELDMARQQEREQDQRGP
ncbi:hypothetical protein I7I51_02967 [Histoplasma capsulatum]|uniref:Uncharacterized protein n=1 Tax=Ajellomyces capsulatus TaxID=5037 RepID=A0A8A1MJJ1_AJECA|nr:predicted protein [Histoplasma mississippiense (nom. inval.)]EDN11335.1 predicted protein [Histoplasma mississippiense (nom. inval.)]QSS66758.1 hypothetical protein I7I51_02967 [Histoplasma capsulatum]